MKEETSNEARTSPRKDHKPPHSNPSSNNPFTPKPSSAFRSENPSNSDARNRTKNYKEKPKHFSSDKVGKNGKLTTEERERRIKEDLCLYCGEKGHKAQDCPKSKAAKARASALTSDEPAAGSADSKK
jgi:Zinc knuckle